MLTISNDFCEINVNNHKVKVTGIEIHEKLLKSTYYAYITPEKYAIVPFLDYTEIYSPDEYTVVITPEESQ